MMAELRITETSIPGLLVLDLPLHGDARGWFKENWHREKMVALGLPDFAPVQNNMSHNTQAGVTRGFHAEPWDKLVSVASGRIFGAWVDLRAGDSFGSVVTVEMGPDKAVFVPRGVGNAYQALEDGTTYTYLVNEHWSAEARQRYTYLNLADETVAVDWPIPLADSVRSEADLFHPRLADVTPFPAAKVLVTGGNGQLGRALREVFPDATYVDLDELDIADPASVSAFDFDGVRTIVNAAAWTAVDAAEAEGRAACWRANASGVANLAAAARRHRATLVHISSDYVFDGTHESHTEDEPLSPLSAYGAAKAAGDIAAASWERHYIVRTSWVIGQGRNFVSTMADLARRGISPGVVDDQYGRLTFTEDLAAGIAHLLKTGAPYGTYNLTSSGPVQTWYSIASDVFAALGAPGRVSPVSTEDYGAGKNLAPRPRHSTLDLSKITAAGFVSGDGAVRLRGYLAGLG